MVGVLMSEIRYHKSMGCGSELAQKDAGFVQIIDTVFADAAARSGVHLACRVGCAQCCTGAFAINTLDALRLQRGLHALSSSDPGRASRVRWRAQDYVNRLGATYPGDSATGTLYQDAVSLERFDEFANDEPCPALDPATRTCDLYASRPLTCRIFGPPVRSEGGLAVCELCFTEAAPEEIAACEMAVDPGGLELELDAEAERSQSEAGGQPGPTVVAWALLSTPLPNCGAGDW